MPNSNSGIAPVFGLAVLCFSVSAAALDTNYYVGARADYSDNIRLVATDQNEENEAPVSAIAGIQMTELSSLIDLSADADFQYINYTQNTFDDELLANANIDLEIFIIPQRFHWTVEDDFGQILGEPLAVPSPANREDTNVFVTGPDVFFRLSNRDVLTLTGRWVDDWYEEQAFDNQRTIIGGNYTRSLASERSIGLYASQTTVDYDNFTDYDRKDAFFRFLSATSKSTFRLDAGYSKVESDPEVVALDGGGSTVVESDDSGLLFEIEFSREISGSTRVTALYGNSYSDSGERFRDLNDAGDGIDINVEDVNIADDPFRLQEFSFAVDRATNVDNLNVRFGFDDEDYTQSSENDRQLGSVYVSYLRRLGRSFRLGVNANYIMRDYSVADREDKDWSVFLVGTYDINDRLGLRLEAGPRRRDSTGFDAGTEFKESRAMLEIVYATGSYRG